MAYVKPGLQEAGQTALRDTGTLAGLGQRWRHLDKSSWVWLVAIVVLVFLVVNPLLRLFVVSFQDAQRRLHAGQLLWRPTAACATWRRWATRWCSGLSSRPHVPAVRRADGLGAVAHRHAVQGRSSGSRSWAPSSFRPTSAPSAGSCWPGPNAGWLNRAVVALTGAESGPFNIYSMPGLVLVVALYSFPYVFVFTKSALDLISSEMEDAANILGASNMRTTLHDHAAAGAAGDPGRLHPGVPGGDRAVRLAGAAGAAGAASTW